MLGATGRAYGPSAVILKALHSPNTSLSVGILGPIFIPCWCVFDEDALQTRTEIPEWLESGRIQAPFRWSLATLKVQAISGCIHLNHAGIRRDFNLKYLARALIGAIEIDMKLYVTCIINMRSRNSIYCLI